MIIISKVNMSIIAFSLFSSLSLTGCSHDENEGTTIFVASERSYACGYDGIVRPHHLIKEGKDTAWKRATLFGFHWEKGYEYKLEVKDVSKNNCDPVDDVNAAFEVVAIISKTKKESTNLPPELYNEEWPEGISCDDVRDR